MISHVLGIKKKPKFWPKKIPKITKKKKKAEYYQRDEKCCLKSIC